jgi:hypothetical protein
MAPTTRTTLADCTVTFGPWLVYILASQALGSWRYGFALGFATSLCVVGWRMMHRDNRFIDVGTLGFCSVLFGVAIAYPKSPIGPYDIPLNLAAFGGLSLVSLAIGTPFTYRIVRDKVPQRILDDPDRHHHLRRAHVTATAIWATAQVAAGAAGFALIAEGLAPASAATQAAGTLVPVGVTRYLHNRSVNLARTTPPVPGSATGRDEPADAGAHDAAQPAGTAPRRPLLGRFMALDESL